MIGGVGDDFLEEVAAAATVPEMVVRIEDGQIAADVEWLSDQHERDSSSRDYLTGLRSRQAALEWFPQRTSRIPAAMVSGLVAGPEKWVRNFPFGPIR